MGCWSEVLRFGARKEEPGALRARGEPHAFDVLRGSLKIARVEWSLLGEHNQLNALAAIAAAEHVGVAPEVAAQALASFENVRRRLELRGEAGGIKVYDDFAHHPTAMRTTVNGLRRKVGTAAHPGRVRAALEHHEARHDEGAAALVAGGGRPGLLPQRRPGLERRGGARADGQAGRGLRQHRQAGRRASSPRRGRATTSCA